MQTLTVHRAAAASTNSAAAVSAPDTTLENAGDADTGASMLPVDHGLDVSAEMHQRSVKGEDHCFCYRADPALMGRPMPANREGEPDTWRLNYDVFVVCDGHSGTAAWEYVHREFLACLDPLMPRALPPSFRTPSGQAYAAQVRTALASCLVQLNDGFCRTESLSGCTVTICLVTGNLVTIANVGDSDALMDVFSDALIMSTPHRVQDNEAERDRVLASGATIAPLSQQMDGPAKPSEPGLGPLRIWPGGLCVSRGVGDIDVGHVVIADPHIRQVIVPPWGARVVLASDGLWDCLAFRLVVSTMRGKATAAAALALVQKCLRVRQGALVDDTTCCIVDCMPHGVETFKAYNPEKTVHGGASQVRAQTAPLLMQKRGSQALRDGMNNMTAPQLRAPRNGSTTIEKLDEDAAECDEHASTAPLPAGRRGNGEASGANAGPAGENGATAASVQSIKPSRYEKRGLLCCVTMTPVYDPDELSQRGSDEASQKMAQSASAGNLTTSSGPDSTNNSVHKGNTNKSRSANKSVAGGKVNLGMAIKKRSVLGPVELYADVDMAFEGAALATVSEGSQSSRGGAAEKKPGFDMFSAETQESGTPVDPELIEMTFQPSHQRHEDPRHTPGHSTDRGAQGFHTVSHTETDFTTRPHKAMYDSRHLAVPLPPMD